MSRKEILDQLQQLNREKEVLSYIRYKTGSQYARNRVVNDEIYKYSKMLADNKDAE